MILVLSTYLTQIFGRAFIQTFDRLIVMSDGMRGGLGAHRAADDAGLIVGCLNDRHLERLNCHRFSVKCSWVRKIIRAVGTRTRVMGRPGQSERLL